MALSIIIKEKVKKGFMVEAKLELLRPLLY